MRRVLRSSVMVSTAIAAALIAGCGSDDGRVDRYASAGWPAMHADARNSDTSPVTGSRDVEFAWSRPLGGPVAAYASVAANGQSFVTARTENGCNLFSFQMDTGRKKWCARLNDGVVASTPIVDTATNVYVGESGAMMSFTETGQLRWRTLVVGTPLSSQFTGDGNLLFITQLGQINVLNPQTGAKVVPSFDLIPPPSIDQGANAELIPDNKGLNECFLGTSGCPVANTPAVTWHRQVLLHLLRTQFSGSRSGRHEVHGRRQSVHHPRVVHRRASRWNGVEPGPVEGRQDRLRHRQQRISLGSER